MQWCIKFKKVFPRRAQCLFVSGTVFTAWARCTVARTWHHRPVADAAVRSSLMLAAVMTSRTRLDSPHQHTAASQWRDWVRCFAASRESRRKRRRRCRKMCVVLDDCWWLQLQWVWRLVVVSFLHTWCLEIVVFWKPREIICAAGYGIYTLALYANKYRSHRPASCRLFRTFSYR